MLLHHLYVETHRAEAIVAANHGTIGILHPSVEEVALAARQSLYKLTHSLPRLGAQTLWATALLAYPPLTLAHIASVLYRVLVASHQVIVLHLADSRNLYFLHIHNISDYFHKNI